MSPAPAKEAYICDEGVALFHSVLGVRPGVHDAAKGLRAAGHEVLAVDQYDGKMFDDHDEAGAYVEAIGFPELMRRAVAAVQGLPDGLVAAFAVAANVVAFTRGTDDLDAWADQARVQLGALELAGDDAASTFRPSAGRRAHPAQRPGGSRSPGTDGLAPVRTCAG